VVVRRCRCQHIMAGLWAYLEAAGRVGGGPEGVVLWCRFLLPRTDDGVVRFFVVGCRRLRGVDPLVPFRYRFWSVLRVCVSYVCGCLNNSWYCLVSRQFVVCRVREWMEFPWCVWVVWGWVALYVGCGVLGFDRVGVGVAFDVGCGWLRALLPCSVS